MARLQSAAQSASSSVSEQEQQLAEVQEQLAAAKAANQSQEDLLEQLQGAVDDAVAAREDADTKAAAAASALQGQEVVGVLLLPCPALCCLTVCRFCGVQTRKKPGTRQWRNLPRRTQTPANSRTSCAKLLAS